MPASELTRMTKRIWTHLCSSSQECTQWHISKRIKCFNSHGALPWLDAEQLKKERDGIHCVIYLPSQPASQPATLPPTHPPTHSSIHLSICSVSHLSIYPCKDTYIFDKHTSPLFTHVFYIQMPIKNESFRGSFYGPNSPQGLCLPEQQMKNIAA